MFTPFFKKILPGHICCRFRRGHQPNLASIYKSIFMMKAAPADHEDPMDIDQEGGISHDAPQSFKECLPKPKRARRMVVDNPSRADNDTHCFATWSGLATALYIHGEKLRVRKLTSTCDNALNEHSYNDSRRFLKRSIDVTYQ